MLGAGACGVKEVGPGTAADKVLPGAEMLEAFDAAVEASPTTIPEATNFANFRSIL
jgi:hypothetical protein